MSYNSVIRSEDVQAFEKLNENYDHIKSRQDFMQKVNDYFKENGRVEGCPGVEFETLANIHERMKDNIGLPYPESFFNTNSKTMEMLQSMMNRVADNPETLFRSWHFKGGEAVVNLANNRLQLMFDEKPTQENLTKLKQHGFKWAPKVKAWQRQLTHKTMAVCDKIDFLKPFDGKKPTDLQPNPPKRNEPER